MKAEFYKGGIKMSMTYERQKEMLNKIIDHESIGRNCKETIRHLLYLGFTDEELFNDFSFNLHDIEDAEEDMDYYEED